MGFDYISYRKTKRSGKYKLFKRTAKMLEMIRKYKAGDSLCILDVGAADGFMLNTFKNQLSVKVCVGIEPSLDYIKSNSAKGIQIIQAIGEKLPFRSNIFDVVTAASVVDHMDDFNLFLRECDRVLRDGGILAITLASPFYDGLAVKFRVKEDDHKFHFTERKLREALEKEGFLVNEISRFALPFFGIAFEKYIERILNSVGLRWAMFYIAAVSQTRKKNK
jgi:ubiquinone/menaquinone biosynthesis C-methylase UbiE